MHRHDIFAITERLLENKRLKTAVLSSCVLTLFAHAYSFFNSTFTNDRMTFFGEPSYITAIAGKWFTQFYEHMHGWSYLPWLEGALMIVYIAVSVYATVEVLQIERKLSIWIVAGLYATNISVVTGNFYGGDDFTFALVTACLSAWVWSLGDRKLDGTIGSAFCRFAGLRIVAGALLISVCLGIYGSYASAAPALVVMGVLALLFQGKETAYAAKRLMEYVVTFGVGMIIYYIILRAFLHFQDLEMQTYMGQNQLVSGVPMKELIRCAGLAYKNAFGTWMGHVPYPPIRGGAALAIFIFGIAAFVALTIKKRNFLRASSKVVLMVVLLAIFPFSAGMIYVMAFGNVHYLMVFSFCLFYVGAIKITEDLLSSDDGFGNRVSAKAFYGGIPTILVVLLVIMVCRGVLISNMAYNALEKSTVASMSIATRLMDRIEDCEGSNGTEPVVFIGDLSDNAYFRNPESTYWKEQIGGMGTATYSVAFAYYGNTRTFLHDVMGFYREMQYYVIGNGAFGEEEQELSEMPVFPADGSVRLLKGSVVVKLSE